MKFTDTPTFKKGLLGENFVRKMLNQKGWITYSPDCDGAHYFDILATKNKQSVIAVDVKTKARFNKWAAQGIDIRHYNEYMRFTQQTGIPFYLVFVDDKNGDVHAGELAKLKALIQSCAAHHSLAAQRDEKDLHNNRHRFAYRDVVA